jgi:hypothetical protein
MKLNPLCVLHLYYYIILYFMWKPQLFVLYIYDLCSYDLFHILLSFSTNSGAMECDICMYVIELFLCLSILPCHEDIWGA